MTQKDLKENNRYVYAKLRNKPFCSYCGKIISKTDDIEFSRIKHFRGRVEYKFYHEFCMRGASE